jgi:hypothetical protein
MAQEICKESEAGRIHVGCMYASWADGRVSAHCADATYDSAEKDCGNLLLVGICAKHLSCRICQDLLLQRLGTEPIALRPRSGFPRYSTHA